MGQPVPAPGRLVTGGTGINPGCRTGCRVLRDVPEKTTMHDHDHHLDPAQVSERFRLHMESDRFLGRLDNPDGTAELTGGCGDSVGMEICVADGQLRDIRIQPQGCVFTQACANAVAVLASGKYLDDMLALDVPDVVEEVGGLPEDHLHCARLALNTLGEAILDYIARQAGRQ